MASIMEKVHDKMAQAGDAIQDSATFGNPKVANIKSDIVDGNSQSQKMTTDFGVGISEAAANSWLRVVDEAGRQGPMLLEDSISREKIHRFDHERIPERVVHARGAGAFGYFKLKESAADVTCAAVLTDTSRTTPVFVRFSTVLGSRGSADTVRDVRGFAVKFYTQEGNWDIVGNDIPVFFIQDAVKFPDLIHAAKPEPDNEVPQAQSAHNNFWDFNILHSEATHMLMWAMSDRGIPRSYRMMQGFGVNTFTFTTAEGQRSFVKFHFKPELGVHSLVWDEALKLCGQDPDFHRKDLEEAIKNGAPAKWDFGIQIITEAQQDEFEFDILDATKVWPEELVPVRYIGELVLDRCVDEYFSQTEQVAFCTSHVVPGIGFSDDPLLQGRNFSYFDTQISRLGINWQELPINRPVCPYLNMNRDGAMRHRITKGKVNYWPNRFQGTPPVLQSQASDAVAAATTYKEHAQPVIGIKQRLQAPKFKEHINQATLFWNSMSPIEKLHIIKAFSFELSHCDDETVFNNACLRLGQIHTELAEEVASRVGGTSPKEKRESRKVHSKKSERLSQMAFQPATPTIKSRRVAILIADGYDKFFVTAAKAALTAAGAVPLIIGPRRNYIYANGEERGQEGAGIWADHHFEDQRSTMFDGLLLPPGAHTVTLTSNGRVVHWIRESFGHLKPIGAVGAAVDVVKHALQLPVVHTADAASESVVDSYGVVTVGNLEASGLTELVKITKEADDFMGKFAYRLSMHRCWERELDGLMDRVAF
ncbi:catalase-1 [Drechslerella stenobrocha 248]|uniref:Catalase n=1 Tax=Drechslerella stenobrocha 248 TaxID=1043628 RepID=W7I495_9PEZI|nr:catalase-1 [Drechslerella stenobrocha 248]